MTKYRTGVLGVFVIFLILSSLYVNAADMSQKMTLELMATLNDFAQKHSLNDTQMEKLLGDIVLDSQQFRKGGVGSIANEVYVVLNEPKNAVIIKGQRWEGKKSSESEIVLTDGHRVLDSQTGVDVSKLIIIVFSPKEVRFINLSTNSGGKYLR